MSAAMARLPRTSGVLVHPTSLPGRYGIGDLGSGVRQLLDFLTQGRQRLWQVLPLTPTGFGDSPYFAPSAFAGNPLLVSVETLRAQGLLDSGDVAELAALPSERVAFGELSEAKARVLETAFERFERQADEAWRARFDVFQREEASWLDDYVLFMALHQREGRPPLWTDWEPALRDRDSHALEVARARHARAIASHTFAQFMFHEQWQGVRHAAARQGIRLVGDIPIFVAHDSADVWVHRHLFELDEQGRPRRVAGVPPDYFSETGQLWGSPLYDWAAMARDGYRWWIDRFRRLLRQVDVVRIDHFRGFQAAWGVPARAETAVDGQWVAGPGSELFRAVAAALGGAVPTIAEDLGLITDEVRALRAELGYPGMKVLQFAFGGGPDNPYLPHNYDDPNCVVYTGTHDNDTTRGWFATAPEPERAFARRYLGSSGEAVAWELLRLALASVADTAIIPLQDVLNLGSEARMNTPGAALGNWQWRVAPELLRPETAARLGELAWLYGRAQGAEA